LHRKGMSVLTYETLSSIVRKAFVLRPPASLVPDTEKFWVIREDEPELVTDGKRKYWWCGSGELSLLVPERLTDALIFRVPTVKGRKRSITIDKHTWDQGRVFSCGITAVPVQENEKCVINGGFTAAFGIRKHSGLAVVHMLPHRHHTTEISQLMYDTASHVLVLLSFLNLD